MYRFLKWLIWIAGIFFVFIVIAVIAIQIFLSSDEIKKIAEREGQNILGRKVSIERLNLGLFKIEAGGIVIEGEENREKSKSFVRLDDVEIVLNPSALIYKQISILQLIVKGASGHLYRDAKGRFNFQDIIDNLNQETKKTVSTRVINKGISLSLVSEAEAVEGGQTSSGQEFHLTIHELDLYNVNTELRLEASDTTTAFKGSCSFAHIEVDRIRPGEPFDGFLDGICQEPGGQQFLQLKGDVHVDMNRRIYRTSFEVPLLDSSFLTVLAPTIPGYRFRKGIISGNFKFDFIVGKPLAWDIDLQGRTIHADFKLTPQAKWRSLTLPGLKLKTKGRFDLFDGSARIETFFVDTYFLEVNLTKPAFWNVSAKDEVHAEMNIRDMRVVGEWISRISNISLQGLRERATARILVSAERNRRIPDDFRLEINSRFDPMELALFNEFIPTVANVSKLNGKVGGKAKVVFVSGERVQWDIALVARDMSVSARSNKKKRQGLLKLGRIILHTNGNFDLKNESARINTFDIKIPFAAAKIERPAIWNVEGIDEAAFVVDVNDLSSATELLEVFGLVSFEDVPGDVKIRFNAIVSRNRESPSVFKVDAKARFASLPIAPFVKLFPLMAYVRKTTGRMSGELQVSSDPDGAFRWKADIVGQKFGTEARFISKGKWRHVFLESIGLQSSGIYLASKGSSEIETLDLRLPFARMYLNRMALWNTKGRDEFSLTFDVTDLIAAEVWLSELLENPVTAGPDKKKFEISLSGTRDRKNGAGFFYKGSASFEPIRISPWVEFLPISSVVRDPAGEVGGKIEFSYAPGEMVNWILDLKSENLRWKFLGLASRDWRVVRTGKLRVESAGSYDFKSLNGRLQRLNLNIPFGYVRTTRPLDWGMHGVDSGRFQWAVSSLEGASRFAGSILGESISKFSLSGKANGWTEFSRNRKKARAISTKWSFAADLSSLTHIDYPNLKVVGNISGRVDDEVTAIRIPTFKTFNIRKSNSEPDIIFRDLRASLDRSSILRGEIRSPSVHINKLNARYIRHENGKSNFGSLFMAKRVGKKRARRLINREKMVSVDAQKESKKHQKVVHMEGKPLFPALKIAKFEVARIGFHFQDFIAADKPPVVLRVPNARLSITNLNTLMAHGQRKTRLEFRTFGKSPSILVKANLNPSMIPPDLDGFFNLSRFDLRKISPYVRDIEGESPSALLMRGTEITKGTLDFKSNYSLSNKQLELDGRAKIVGLRLKPDEKFPLADLVVKLLRESVFRLFKSSNDTISLNVRVSGRLDDPEFHFLDAIVEPIFVGLFERAQNLGGNVKDIVTGILGTAIEGVQKIVPIPKYSRTSPDKDSGKEPEKNQLKQLGKSLEKTLQKGLRGLFGVK